MRRTSKYATLALLISTVGPVALQAADRIPYIPSCSGGSEGPLFFPKGNRSAERRARSAARRLRVYVNEVH